METANIVQLNSDEKLKLKKELEKILSLNLDITGELVEVALENTLPYAKRDLLNSRDKRWIDVILPDRGIEVKTFQVAKSMKTIQPGTQVKNVLKRVSQVPYLDDYGERKEASDIGKELIEYLHSTIKEHARQKGVTGNLTMGILFRTVDNSHFAFWEQELNFGMHTDYDWRWNTNQTTKNTTHTIVGEKNGEEVFRWYCYNQKQLFYRYHVVSEASFFSISEDEKRKKTFLITEEELNRKLTHAFEQGAATRY